MTMPLLEAMAKMRTEETSRLGFKVIEFPAVDDAIRLQEHIGLQILTDGEIRRSIFFGFLCPERADLNLFKVQQCDSATRNLTMRWK